MNMVPIDSILCPVCKERLSPQVNMYTCANGHPFNVAREGYINLLLSHQRKSKNPGDDAEMVRARRRFFDSGAFDPLVEQLCAAPLFQRSDLSVLDCGCGEGHFLGALSEKRDGFFCGLDISKKAIQMAAKRYKQARWIVANGMRDIPVASGSMGVILSVLAPRNMSEFARILRPDGALLIGVPGPNHLGELRKRLQFSSGDFSEKADEAAAKCAPLFVESNRVEVRYERLLGQDEIADLIQMTPIFWRSSPSAKVDVFALDKLSVTISLALLTLCPV
jgi:23S rRNA (guanine745-N1)-methyltransferase